MKNIITLFLSCFIAYFFTACSPTIHKFVYKIDTNPRGAEIICDGKSMGFSPQSYTFNINDKEYEKNKETKQKLPSCKAKWWASGYVDFYPTTTRYSDFSFVREYYGGTKEYHLTKTLTRKQGSKDYELDKIAGVRYKKIINASNFNFEIYPKGGQLVCDKKPNKRQLLTKNALKTGIIQIPKCKAVFVSGYEQSFKNNINIDKEKISTLTNQKIIRPNTDGYAIDMQFALEVEKKEILEKSEKARIQAAQRAAQAAEAQALAQQRAAQAQEDQANQQRSIKNIFKYGYDYGF